VAADAGVRLDVHKVTDGQDQLLRLLRQLARRGQDEGLDPEVFEWRRWLIRIVSVCVSWSAAAHNRTSQTHAARDDTMNPQHSLARPDVDPLADDHRDERGLAGPGLGL
jgi:hypothetical protein